MLVKKIRFEGNGYKEWQEEAQRRGLSVDSDCVWGRSKALLGSESQKIVRKRTGSLPNSELEARFEIKNEIYLKKLQIESRVLGDLAFESYYPDSDLIKIP